MKFGEYFNSPIGTIGIIEENSKVTNIFLKNHDNHIFFHEQSTMIIKDARRQLQEYFDGKRKTFDLPLALEGTNFQKSVWQALLTIPYGETRSYQQIASQIGNSNACRAVGMANHYNPILIVVPCHRVIGKKGDLTGYGGGLETKARLLALEKLVLNEV